MQNTEFIVTSERLGFRLPQDSDLDDHVRQDTDPEVRTQFPDGVLTPLQVRQRISKNTACYSANGFGDFAVIEIETGNFVGRAGFGLLDDDEVEVGYVFLKEYWGRGLAQESLRTLLAWAETALNVPRILAYAPEQHTASINVMQKCGMRYLKTDIARDVMCTFYEYPLKL